MCKAGYPEGPPFFLESVSPCLSSQTAQRPLWLTLGPKGHMTFKGFCLLLKSHGAGVHREAIQEVGSPAVQSLESGLPPPTSSL